MGRLLSILHNIQLNLLNAVNVLYDAALRVLLISYFLAIFSEISLQQSFVHSHLLDGIPLCAYAESIIHSTADGHLCSFQ